MRPILAPSRAFSSQTQLDTSISEAKQTLKLTRPSSHPLSPLSWDPLSTSTWRASPGHQRTSRVYSAPSATALMDMTPLTHPAAEANGAAPFPSARGTSEPPASSAPSLLVFSGGTAFNSAAPALRRFTTRVAHVLPVSDDGGSTAEIVRVLGGPAVGDIRSRCIRLADESDAEARAVKALLAHRLPPSSPREARLEWYRIVEGDHPLWGGISDAYKHTIRAFLVHFHSAILKHPVEVFDYSNGSVGNFFFAGARIFFRSLEASIFLFSRVARIPEGSLILPAILTDERITLGAELDDGTVIRGQNNISHPYPVRPSGITAPAPSPRTPHVVGEGWGQQGQGQYPAGSEALGVVDKSGLSDPPLTSPIRRIFYLSSDGGTHQEHEVFPRANPRMLQQIEASDAIIYGMGSLYTSVCPSLALRGVGEAIAGREGAPKIALLNGSHDRETRFVCNGQEQSMTASEVLLSMSDILNRRNRVRSPPTRSASPLGDPVLPPDSLSNPPSAYFTALLYPRGGGIVVDEERLRELGVSDVVAVDSVCDDLGRAVYSPEALVEEMRRVVVKQMREARGGEH